MAEIGSLAVSLTMDASKFNGTVSQVDRNLRAMGGELQAIKAKGADFGKSVEGLGQKQEVLNRSLDAASIKLQEQRKRYDELVASGKASDAQLERQAIAVNKAQTEYNRLESELKDVTEQLKIQSSQWTKAGQSLQDIGGKLKSIGDGMTDAGKKLTVGLTTPLAAAGLGAFKLAADFESAFAGVRKTVDTSEAGFKKLEQGIRDMSKQLPASASDIAAVAESAGQLGIAEDKILSFSRTIIDLGESTNLTREQAATEFARFANIVGMSQDDFDRLGSSVVGLGNSMATTEAEIVSMAMRLAAQGKQVGMTEAQIVALAGTMSSLGVQAEMGGTAMTTILKKIQKAVADGGAGLADFAEISQMSTKEFQKLYNTSAISALDAFARGLATISSRGENVSEVLRDVGIKGVYESDVMLRLSGASHLLAEAIDTSTVAWQENTALSKEAAQRYETTASQMSMLKNQIVDVGINIGNILIPMVKDAIDVVGPWVEKFGNLSTETQKTILVLGGLAAAVGPVLIVGGTLISSIGTITGAIGGVTLAVGQAGGMMAFLGVKLSFLTPVLGALTGPIGLTALGITAVGTAAIYTAKELSESSIQLQDWSKGVSKATAEAVGGFVKISDDVGQSLSQLHLTSTAITSEMAADITSKFDAMHSQIVDGANAKHEEQMESLRNFFANSSALTSDEEAKILEKQQQLHEQELEILAAKNKVAADIIKKATDEKRELTDHEREVLNNIKNQMKEEAVRVLSQSEVEQKVILEKMKANASELSAFQAAEVVKNAVKQKEEVVAEAEKTYDESIAHITRMRDEAGLITAEQAERMIAEAQETRDTTIKYAEEMHSNIVSEAKAQAGEHVDQVNWETGEIKSKWQVMKQDVSNKMKQLGSDIKRDWSQAYSDAKKSVTDIYNMATGKFEDMKLSVTNKMAEIKGKIESKWNDAHNFLASINLIDIGKDIIGGLTKGISDKFDSVVATLSKLTDKIPQWVKDALQIKSPSRVMMAIGSDIVAGIDVGIENRQEKLKTTMKTLTNNLLDITNHYRDEEKKIARTANTEIAQIEKRAKEDVEKIYRAASTRKKGIKQDEIIKIRRIHENASAKIAEIERNSTKESVELLSKAQKDKLAEIKLYIDDKKSLDDLTLIEEAYIWEKSIKQFDEFSKERVEAQKNYQNAIQAVNKEITAINEDYSKQVIKINEDLAKQEETLTKAYQDAVDKRAQSLVSFKGLFDAFKAEIDVTGEELLTNLGSQVEGFKQWQTEVEKLSEKAIDKGLLEELRQMGPNALPQLIALNQLTDTQLKQYSDLYKEKSKLARTQAETELKGMKTDTDKQIKELRSAANIQLDGLQKEWNQKIKALTSTTSTELSSLKQIGRDAGQGLLDGLGSMEGALQRKARSIAESISKTIQSSLQIKSPSRVMRGFGVNIGQGLVLGMDDMVSKVSGAAQRLASSVEGNVANGSYSSSVNKSRSYTHGDTIIYVQGNNLSPSEISRKQRQSQRQLAMEWGMA